MQSDVVANIRLDDHLGVGIKATALGGSYERNARRFGRSIRAVMCRRV